MMEIGLITWVLDKVHGWASLNKEDRIAAIDGLTPAVAATIAYNEMIESGRPRVEAEERRLHELWFAASSAVSRYDKALALVCREKARYWLKYDEYTDDHVIQLNISLLDVAHALERLKYD